MGDRLRLDHVLAIIQSGTGLTFATFATIHLGGHLLSHIDFDLSNSVLHAVRPYYQNAVVEPIVVFGSVIIHAVVSVTRWYLRRGRTSGAAKENSTVPYAVSERKWHRNMGWVLLPLFCIHSNATRIGLLKGYALDKMPNFDLYQASLPAHLFPMFFTPYYSLLTGGLLIHMAYGIGYAMQTFGVKMPTIQDKDKRTIWYYALAAIGISTTLAVSGYYYNVRFTPEHIKIASGIAADLHPDQLFVKNAIAKMFGSQYVTNWK
ncbi:hypothetical protein SmJEL517_g04038 [Synchytrium microbalum]|uniref:Mitochondrial adapter protein MCP1 transmembrane domain-containing protein n=1 Tax=Synchytrium microbalum TaxID=1806994 RepID=A0A507C0P1_9FUNG|nr:uncharacterized protein SmJEL517_g04038 [Synchytrium microbalum]TPX32981.1 hypothetical protein SmJEL517_g04038 [Synchytrium microbalum]